jgi:DNA-binding NtrC family response regulator
VKLLVVDDDHDVRGVVASFLVDAGYAVLEAEDGQAALTLLTDDPSLRMLISDIRNAWGRPALNWPKRRFPSSRTPSYPDLGIRQSTKYSVAVPEKTVWCL